MTAITKPQLTPCISTILKTAHETYSLKTPSGSHSVNLLYIVGIENGGKSVVVRSVDQETVPSKSIAEKIAKTGMLCTLQLSNKNKTFTTSEVFFKKINKESVVKIFLQKKSGNVDLGYVDVLMSAEKTQYQGFMRILGLYLRQKSL